jgi:hypothetical protein
VKLWVTSVAGKKVALPDCEATREQVPRVRGLTVPAETAQTLGVALTTVTTKPELELALRLCATPFTVVLVNCEKVMD